MTYLDQLRERRSASNATEQKLRLFVPLEEVQAVLVVEGDEDSCLYTDAFHEVVEGAHIRVIICNGKGGVLGLRDFADANFPKAVKLMFFIDRDHDDLLDLIHYDERTYVTDHYSIEWDACTEEILFSLIARHYTLSVGDPIWDVVREKFREMMGTWLNYSCPIMQAVVVARRRGEILDLEQLSLSDICRFHDVTFEHSGSGLEELLTKVGCRACPTDDELTECQKEFGGKDARSYVRGKLVVQFFCEFFRKLSEICGNPEKIDGRGLTTGVQLGKNNYFQFILGDWCAPPSLRTFLSNWESRKTASH
jgi:hypothetical protein